MKLIILVGGKINGSETLSLIQWLVWPWLPIWKRVTNRFAQSVGNVWESSPQESIESVDNLTINPSLINPWLSLNLLMTSIFATNVHKCIHIFQNLIREWQKSLIMHMCSLLRIQDGQGWILLVLPPLVSPC